DVKNRPAAAAASTANHVTTPNSTGPRLEFGNRPLMLNNKNAPPISMAATEVTTRSQYVPRFRAATRSSRSTIGRKVMESLPAKYANYAKRDHGEATHNSGD